MCSITHLVVDAEIDVVYSLLIGPVAAVLVTGVLLLDNFEIVELAALLLVVIDPVLATFEVLHKSL